MRRLHRDLTYTLPSDVKLIEEMAVALPSRAATGCNKFRTSHIRHVLSVFPVANMFPSGCHADEHEQPKCPRKDWMVYKLRQTRRQSRICYLLLKYLLSQKHS